jgi:hypothetical protein
MNETMPSLPPPDDELQRLGETHPFVRQLWRLAGLAPEPYRRELLDLVRDIQPRKAS